MNCYGHLPSRLNWRHLRSCGYLDWRPPRLRRAFSVPPFSVSYPSVRLHQDGHRCNVPEDPEGGGGDPSALYPILWLVSPNLLYLWPSHFQRHHYRSSPAPTDFVSAVTPSRPSVALRIPKLDVSSVTEPECRPGFVGRSSPIDWAIPRGVWP